MRIRVTRHHIDGGDFDHACNCPIYHATLDALAALGESGDQDEDGYPDESGIDIHVDLADIFIDGDWYPLPCEAIHFQASGINGVAVQPFDFEIEYNPTPELVGVS